MDMYCALGSNYERQEKQEIGSPLFCHFEFVLAQENTMWIEEKGQQCEFCNVLGSEDLYVAGCFKIECNGCYIHGKFVNWDTCAVLFKLW